MKPIIKYTSAIDFYKKIFVPSKSQIPDWYKNAKSTMLTEGKKDSKVFLDSRNKNFKLCSPFLDSLTSGYLVLCPVDIIVSHDDFGKPLLNWNINEELVSLRQEQSESIPVPIGCHEDTFVWIFPTAIKLPKGYSALITHPLNRFDLPFVVASGIIDDGYAMAKGNYPFFIKKDFNGIIKQGTPIAQVLPFKRESWVSEDDPLILGEAMLNHKKATAVLFGWYKNTFWKKKQYD